MGYGVWGCLYFTVECVIREFHGGLDPLVSLCLQKCIMGLHLHDHESYIGFFCSHKFVFEFFSLCVHDY